MANNNWNNYTEKTATPVDADEVMVRDSADGKNKKLLFGTFWKWVAKKLNEATISELQTSNKTIVGALNQLNSDMTVKIDKYYTGDGTITIKINWKVTEPIRATIAVISSKGGAIVTELSKSGIVSTNSTDSTVKINFSDGMLTFSGFPWYTTPFFMYDSKIIEMTVK